MLRMKLERCQEGLGFTIQRWPSRLCAKQMVRNGQTSSGAQAVLELLLGEQARANFVIFFL